MNAPNGTSHGHDSDDESDSNSGFDPDRDRNLRTIEAIEQELDVLRSFDHSDIQDLDGGDGLFAVVTDTEAFLTDKTGCFSIRASDDDDEQIHDVAVTDVAVAVAGETVSRITDTGSRTHSKKIPGAQRVLYGPDDTYATVMCVEDPDWNQNWGRNQAQAEIRFIYFDPATRLDRQDSVAGHELDLDLTAAEIRATASGGGWDAFLTEAKLHCVEGAGDASFSLRPADLNAEAAEFIDVSATAQQLVVATGQDLYTIDPAAQEYRGESVPSPVGLSTSARNQVYAWTDSGELFVITDDGDINPIDVAATEVHPAADHSMYALVKGQQPQLDICVRPTTTTIDLDVPSIEFGKSQTVGVTVHNPGPEPFAADAVLETSGASLKPATAPKCGQKDSDSSTGGTGPRERDKTGGDTSGTNTDVSDSAAGMNNENQADDRAKTPPSTTGQMGIEADEPISDPEASVPVSLEVPPFTQRHITIGTVTVPTPVETAQFILRRPSDAGAGLCPGRDSRSVTDVEPAADDVIDEQTVEVTYGEPVCEVTGDLEVLGRESAEVALKISNTGDGIMYVKIMDPPTDEEGESGTGLEAVPHGETHKITAELDIQSLREDPSVSVHYRSAAPTAEWQTVKKKLETSIPTTPCTVASISDAGGNEDGRTVRVDLRNSTDLTVSERVKISRGGTQLAAEVTMPPGETTPIWVLFPTDDTPPRVDSVTVRSANGYVESVETVLTPHDGLSVERHLYDTDDTAIKNGTNLVSRGDRLKDRLSVHNRSTDPICNVTIAGSRDVTIDRINPDERLKFERWVAVPDEGTTLPSVTVTHENQTFVIPKSLPSVDTPDVTCQGHVVDAGHELVFDIDIENHTDTTISLREISLNGESRRTEDSKSVRIEPESTTQYKLEVGADDVPDAVRTKSDQDIKTATIPLDMTFGMDFNRRAGRRAGREVTRRTLVPTVAAPPIRIEADESRDPSDQDDQTDLVVHVENKGAKPIVLDVLVPDQDTRVTATTTPEDTDEQWSKNSRMTIPPDSSAGIHTPALNRALVRFDGYDVQYLLRRDETDNSWTREPIPRADSIASDLLMTTWRRETETDDSG